MFFDILNINSLQSCRYPNEVVLFRIDYNYLPEIGIFANKVADSWFFKGFWQSASNRTIKELKFIKDALLDDLNSASNRTIKELK